MTDLVPARHLLKAANCAELEIEGAVLLRLSGTSQDGSNYEPAAMVYVSPNAKSSFIYKEAIQLWTHFPSTPQKQSIAGFT